MSNATLPLAAASLVVILFSAIAVGSLRAFSRSALEDLCQRAGNRVRLSQILHGREAVALGAETLQVMATAVFLLALGYRIWLDGGWQGVGPWLSGALGAAALLAAEIWIPWTVVRLWATPFLFRTWPAWRVVAAVLSPLAWGARFVDAVFHRLAGRQPLAPNEDAIDHELRTIVDEGHREGLLKEHEREMIEGVIEFADVTVSQIMTPRTDIDCLHVGLPFAEALRAVVKSGHTRIPVYDRNRDDIVGVLYAKDLLAEIAQPPAGAPREIAQLLRAPYFVPESKPVQSLLEEFRRTRSHMAVVLDEYGGVSGLVTIEDLLEEIVGEIVDEYDEDVVEGISSAGDRAVEALARVRVGDINDRLGLDLQDGGDFDTIGGLVFSLLGHIPKPGEQVVVGRARITVLDVTRRRVEKVRVEVVESAARESV